MYHLLRLGRAAFLSQSAPTGSATLPAPSKCFGCLCPGAGLLCAAVTWGEMLWNKLCETSVEPWQGPPPGEAWENGERHCSCPYCSYVADMPDHVTTPGPWPGDWNSQPGLKAALPVWTCVATADLSPALMRATGHALQPALVGGSTALLSPSALAELPLLLLWHLASGKATAEICRASQTCTNKTNIPHHSVVLKCIQEVKGFIWNTDHLLCTKASFFWWCSSFQGKENPTSEIEGDIWKTRLAFHT